MLLVLFVPCQLSGLQPRKRDKFGIFDEVAKVIRTECIEKTFLRLGEYMLEPAHAVDLAGIGVVVETLHEWCGFE